MAAKTLWRRPRRRYPLVDFYWINRFGDLINEENEDLTDPRNSRLQILQFLTGDDAATEIILTPRDLRELRGVLDRSGVKDWERPAPSPNEPARN